MHGSDCELVEDRNSRSGWLTIACGDEGYASRLYGIGSRSTAFVSGGVSSRGLEGQSNAKWRVK